MSARPHHGRWPPLLVLAAFVLVLIAPTALALPALAAALAGPVLFRLARERAGGRSAPDAGAAGERATMLGRTEDQRPFYLTDRQLSAHTIILGASGAGKTTTLLNLITDHVERGRGAVVIDMKGSREFARTLAQAADRAARPFRVWTLDGPGHWNPLEHGNPSELKDRLISAERWTEVHYQRAAERYVQNALRVWEQARPGRSPTLADVVALLDEHRLSIMLREVPRELATEVANYLAGLVSDQLSAVRGLQTRIAILAESQAGPYLAPSNAGTSDLSKAGTIDLPTAMREREVVLFSLNSSRYGQLAAQVGALVVQNLNAAMGTRFEEGATEPVMIGIDELSALGAHHVLGLVAQGREALFPIVAATQEIADIERFAIGLAKQLLGIPGIKIAHRQDLPDSARMIAEIGGTERAWEQTYHTDRRALLPDRETGRGTRREVQRYRVDPDTIKTLSPGEAVVITKIPTPSVQKVTVRPPRRRDPPERE